MYSLPGCGRSYLTCWVLGLVFVSAPQKQLCALSWRDPSICRVLFFSSSFVIRRVLCPCYDLLDVNLCVDNLSSALCKNDSAWNVALTNFGIRVLFWVALVLFWRKKYSYLDIAPEPVAFRNEELEGLLKFSFGRLVLAFSYLHQRAQASFQLFCSRPGYSGMFSAILLFVSGVSF